MTNQRRILARFAQASLLTSLLILGLFFLLKPGSAAATAAPAAFCDTVTGIPLTECEALTALYNSTDGPNWFDNFGWLTSTAPCGVK